MAECLSLNPYINDIVFCILIEILKILITEIFVWAQPINQFKIFGGCCGTDGRHIEEIARRI